MIKGISLFEEGIGSQRKGRIGEKNIQHLAVVEAPKIYKKVTQGFFSHKEDIRPQTLLKL